VPINKEPCFEDDTAYFGNNILFGDKNPQESTFDCQQSCEFHPSCQYWTFQKREGLCYLKLKRERVTTDPSYISGSKKCRLPEWSKEKVQNHQTLIFRADRRKRIHEIPRLIPAFRNDNHQTPRFRFEKRKRNHKIPRFSPGFRNGNHRTLKFKANKRKRKCKNNDKYCEQWSRLGDCNHKVYGPYMKKYCKLSCNLCTR
jgi:hypothetical protein